MAKYGNLLTTLFAALALISAYVMQYGFGLEPCNLCYWQRYPYMAVIFIGIIALTTGYHKIGLSLIVLLLLGDFGVAAFHAGVELGIFELPAGCAADAGQSMQDLMSSLAKPPAQCDRPAFVFLGLSLSMWNAMAALSAAIVGMAFLAKSHQDKA